MIGLTQQEQVEFERIKDEMWNNGYETAKEQFGWHPASKLPEEGSECVVYLENTKVYKYIFSKTSIYNGEWYYCGLHDEPQRIIGWCYPPKEE